MDMPVQSCPVHTPKSNHALGVPSIFIIKRPHSWGSYESVETA